jgi:hypothetical protein
MAKIENIIVYPTVTPSADDLLIATDASDNNKTVTFLVGDIAGGGVLQGLQSVLDTGNIATQTMDLTGDINLLGGPGVGFLETCQIKLAGGYGTPGQVITSQGAGSCAIWDNAAAASCCSLDDTLTIGNTSSQDIVLSSGQFQANGAGGGVVISSPSVLTNSGTSSFTGQVNINSTTLNFNATALLNDGTGSVGLAGQFLTSTGTGVAWSSTLPPSSCCTLQATIAAGNTSTNQNVTLTGTGLWSFGPSVSIESDATNIWNSINTFSNTSVLDLDGPIEDSVGSQGLAGYVLTSTGAGATVWAAASGGTQDLQSVLDIGNTATGANANITISGFIRPGQITDTSGATGAAGQYLTSTGVGLAWVTAPGCCSLDDTLTVGATSGQSITLTGTGTYLGPLAAITQFQDDLGNTGLAGQVLTVNAGATGVTWATGGGGAVIDVDETAPGTSTGTPIIVNPTTGNVLVQSMAYNGGTNVGHVPSGGTLATEYLDGTGSWSVPAGGGGGVTDLSVGAVTSSTGLPILISPASPATGSVTINQSRYMGDLLEGCVPRGSGGVSTVYLDGSGSWSTPASGGSAKQERTQTFRFIVNKGINTNGEWIYMPNPTSSTWGAYSASGVLSQQRADAPDSGAGWTLIDRQGASYYRNPKQGVCTPAIAVETVCSMSIDWVLVSSVATMDFTVFVWKINPCDGDVLPLLVATCAISATLTATVANGCCDMTLTGDIANLTLNPGEGHMYTIQYGSGDVGGVELLVNHTQRTILEAAP